MTVDTVFRGGRVVDPEGIQAVDLAVRDGRIAGRLRPGEPADADRVIDVSGLLLLPGLVDAHVHCREPGLTWKEDFSSATMAAAAGGVTTILVMPTDDPWTATAEQLRAKRAMAEGRIFCDVGLQVAVSRELGGLADLVALGATSFEIFTADVPSAFLFDKPAALQAAVSAVHRAGGRAAVSPGDQSILETELGRLVPGRSSPADFLRTRPDQAEAQGIVSAVLASAKSGAPVHIRQSNSRLGLDVFRRLRALAPVSIETSPQCLFFTTADYELFGPAAKASPPWRDVADRDAVRAAVADGTIDIVVTDHAPHTVEEKAAHPEDFASVPGGFSGVQTLLATLLALVDEGLIDLPRLVSLAAARPADLFGLAGRKGRLAPGTDADILVLDPTRAAVVRGIDQLSKSKFTPFEGLRTSASLNRVFLHGEEIVAEGRIGGRPKGVVISPQR